MHGLCRPDILAYGRVCRLQPAVRRILWPSDVLAMHGRPRPQRRWDGVYIVCRGQLFDVKDPQ